MKLRKINVYIGCCLLLGNTVLSQQKLIKPDTLRFRSVGNTVDTFYKTIQNIGGRTYKQVTYYGFSDNSNLSTAIDTFIVGKTAWEKLYHNKALPFLSVKDFTAKRKTNEYLSTESKTSFYYEYEPVKVIRVKKKQFYLYRVRPMSGRGMVEGLGDGPYHIVFDFTVGEIYRSSFRITKVLSGYERYVPYFKW